MTIATLFFALLVTAAADRSGGEPILLDFHASWCNPCQTMKPEIARLAQKKYPIQSVDIDQDPALAKRYDVKSVPTFIVVDPQGKELDRTQGVIKASDLAAMYNQAKQKFDAALDQAGPRETQTTASRPSEDDETDDSLAHRAANPVNPKPWETVVRIKMHLSEKKWGFGSGTIIYSDADESIILTCAHIFRDQNQKAQALKNFRTPIRVDLFSTNFVTLKPVATLSCVQDDLVGEAINYDFINDVGLIRIRPGRRLPASRVVPAHWEPQRGMKMYSVGCSHGHDATAWDTRILDPKIKMNSGESDQSFYEMKCLTQPAEGRSGGGLYTTDGYVAGVCDFADPNEHVGLYATPSAIHRLLDKSNLTALYQPPTNGSGQLYAARSQSQTKFRAQSPSELDERSGDSKTFTIPDPGMFRIPSPETRIASNRDQAKAWPTPEIDDRRPVRPSRRPEQNPGVSIDPGARPGAVLLTEIPLEPNSDATTSDVVDKSPSRSETAIGNNSVSKWRKVQPTRPRSSVN